MLKRKGSMLDLTRVIPVSFVIILSFMILVMALNNIAVVREGIGDSVTNRTVLSMSNNVMTSSVLTAEKYVFDRNKLDARGKQVHCWPQNPECIGFGLQDTRYWIRVKDSEKEWTFTTMTSTQAEKAGPKIRHIINIRDSEGRTGVGLLEFMVMPK